jgi:nickel superoxide dismutase
MFEKTLSALADKFSLTTVEAHCDGPCGVYDPSSARVAAEAVLSMTKKINALEVPAATDKKATIAYQNTLTRFIQIKEQQAELTKRELLILWTDYFKPEHLKAIPDLHEVFWKAAKLCSACKVNVSEESATDLLKTVEKVHGLFWSTKNRQVAWYTAG